MPADIGKAFTRFTHLPAFPFAPLTIFWGERITHIDLNAIRPVREIAALAPRPIFLISDLLDEIVDQPFDGELPRQRGPAKRTLATARMPPRAVLRQPARCRYISRVSDFLGKSFALNHAQAERVG